MQTDSMEYVRVLADQFANYPDGADPQVAAYLIREVAVANGITNDDQIFRIAQEYLESYGAEFPRGVDASIVADYLENGRQVDSAIASAIERAILSVGLPSESFVMNNLDAIMREARAYLYVMLSTGGMYSRNAIRAMEDLVDVVAGAPAAGDVVRARPISPLNDIADSLADFAEDAGKALAKAAKAGKAVAKGGKVIPLLGAAVGVGFLGYMIYEINDSDLSAEAKSEARELALRKFVSESTLVQMAGGTALDSIQIDGHSLSYWVEQYTGEEFKTLDDLRAWADPSRVEGDIEAFRERYGEEAVESLTTLQEDLNEFKRLLDSAADAIRDAVRGEEHSEVTDGRTQLADALESLSSAIDDGDASAARSRADGVLEAIVSYRRTIEDVDGLEDEVDALDTLASAVSEFQSNTSSGTAYAALDTDEIEPPAIQRTGTPRGVA